MHDDKSRIKSGDMEADLAARADGLIDEFVAEVDAIVEKRHLQKGIARIQLPFSMVAILDKENLSILGQFRMENRLASYFHRPDIALSRQQIANSAQWEFGFEDPFIIQLPATLMDQSTEERNAVLRIAAGNYIDSEYLRLEEKLCLMRTRPIFGPAGEPVKAGTILLLLPRTAESPDIKGTIQSALSANDLPYEDAADIRRGKAAVREMWYSINQAAVILADLTGPDPAVMYGLGIAHALGKETVLVYPQGSKYLRDIPRTNGIEYEDSKPGMARLEEELTRMLGAILSPIVEG